MYCLSVHAHAASQEIEHKPKFALVIGLLKEVRLRAGLAQAMLGRALARPQTYVSDCELGVRRHDVVQAHEWCVVWNESLGLCQAVGSET